MVWMTEKNVAYFERKGKKKELKEKRKKKWKEVKK